ncbi:MAG: cytochrome c oxidase accessory protein CcoG [Paucibacter sp.]|nr:cytochrome c oxidase accessory protein CcoG [Roseateles sp.]
MTDPRPATPDAPVQVVSLYQKQATIQARSVQGWYTNWRWVLVALTQLLFYGAPWLAWNGRQLVLFDLAARRFYLGGLVLYPQDFIYLTGLLVLSAYALFFFTAVAGRLWCGYACPQTVYTEIFMWIERRFEGDRSARLRLDGAPWTREKLLRRGGKHLAWLVVAMWTGFTFVGYFTPIRSLWHEAFTLDFGPWEWFWVNFYAFATWGNAGFMREQVCKYMCPYARFQSAMFDRDTLVIGYDAGRGEPRGPRARDVATRTQGDCIDCKLCVQVCPTGIDIRDGLQYECIGCAACVDACNGVMDKVGYARGLVRYSTENAMEQAWPQAQIWRRVLRPRVLVYGVVLLLIAALVAGSIALRKPFRVDVLRDRSSLARLVEHGRIENLYRLQIMNATETPQQYLISAEGLDGIAVSERQAIEVDPAAARWVAVHTQVPPETAARVAPGVHAIHFVVTRVDSTERDEVREKSTFILPY